MGLASAWLAVNIVFRLIQSPPLCQSYPFGLSCFLVCHRGYTSRSAELARGRSVVDGLCLNVIRRLFQ